MIRSSQHSLRFANKEKLSKLSLIAEEYQRLVEQLIDYLWNNNIQELNLNIKKNKLNTKGSLVPNHILKAFQTWLSARLKQAAGKQALGMIKAATEKRRKQLWMLKKLQKENKDSAKLQRKIDKQKLIKPSSKNIKMELDSRFVDFGKAKDFSFLRLTSIGKKISLKLPFKETRPSKKWLKKGKRKPAIRLSKDSLWLLYHVEDPKKKKEGDILGADQGLTAALTLSNGVVTKKCKHGHDLSSITKKLSRKKKGSKAFRAVQQHRKNYINWSLNQLNFKNTKEVRLEKVKQIRFKRRSSRFLSHWTYTLIKEKLSSLSETEGFVLREVANEFRSQRCNKCGLVRKANRKGKAFKCKSCNYENDSDLNAALNLKLDLFKIPYWVRLKKLNQKGFYWKSKGLEDLNGKSIVSHAKEI